MRDFRSHSRTFIVRLFRLIILRFTSQEKHCLSQKFALPEMSQKVALDRDLCFFAISHCPPLRLTVTPVAFTGLALVVSGLSVDAPHGGRYPPIGTEMGTGIPHCEASKCTSLRAFSFENLILAGRFCYMSSGLLYNEV